MTYQRCLDIILSGLEWNTCLVYLDDILIFAKTHTEMLSRLNEILKRLNEAGLKLRLEKCKFSQQQVQYLGHVISEHGIAPDPIKVKAIQDIPTPQTVKEVKSFLGLPSYYLRFIPNCSKIAQPLIHLLTKNTKFSWGPEQNEAFIALKRALCNAPILIHPDFSKPFILQTDASTLGIGAVLSQIGPDNLEHPIAYASRSLNKAEKIIR